MSEIKREPKFEQTPSPPPHAIDCRTGRDCNRDGSFELNSNSNPQLSPNSQIPVTGKPELTFSIERILGLNNFRNDSNKSTTNFSKMYHHQSAVRDADCSGYSAVFHRSYSHHRPSMTTATHPFCDEDYEEEDVVDDEEDDDDDEYIDVDVDDTAAGPNGPDPNDEVSFVSGYSKFDLNDASAKYQWLQCTRYHPPKIHRTKKAVTKKRKLGRNPRVPFTPHQVSVLEEKFRRTHYLSSMDVVELSTALSLTETRVKIWFQNRRARERRDKEASQRNQTPNINTNKNNNNTNNNNTNKTSNFQPLTIPSVAWPITSPMAGGNYPRFDNALNFRPGYLSSAFRLYSPSAIAAVASAAGGGVGVDSIETKQVPAAPCPSNNNRLQPPVQEGGSPRALIAFK